MENEVLVSGRSLQDYLKYYGFDSNGRYSLVDLEIKRFELLKKEPQNKDNIENIYHTLLDLKINAFNTAGKPLDELYKYKQMYLREFQSKFSNSETGRKDDVSFGNNQTLNKIIIQISDYVNKTHKDLLNANTLQEINHINNSFFNEYSYLLVYFLNNYVQELIIRNKSRGSDSLERAKNSLTKNLPIVSIRNFVSIIQDSIRNQLKIDKDRKKQDDIKQTVINRLKANRKMVENIFCNQQYQELLNNYKMEIDMFLNAMWQEKYSEIYEKNIENDEQANIEYKETLKKVYEEVDKYIKDLIETIKSDLNSKNQRAFESRAMSGMDFMALKTSIQNLNEIDDLTTFSQGSQTDSQDAQSDGRVAK